jgi:hypothetical protein
MAEEVSALCDGYGAGLGLLDEHGGKHRTGRKQSGLRATLQFVAKRHWRDTRRSLAARYPHAVLGEVADGMLAQAADPVPDWKVVRPEIEAEISRQSGQILAEAEADYDDYDKRRARAEHEYGRADFWVCAISGAVAGYLLCVFLLPGYLPLAAHLPGHGLTPFIVSSLVIALAVRWRIWRRRRSADIRAVPEAYQRWVYVLREQVLRPFVVELLNDEERNPRLFDMSLSQKAPPRLTEGTEPKRLVTTEAMDRIGAIARNIQFGSLGVSGPRGVGKSAIVNFFCDDRYAAFSADPAGGSVAAGSGRSKDLRLAVAAPVDYQPREFIIHLYLRFCEAAEHAAGYTSPMGLRARREKEMLNYLRTYTTSWSASLTLKSLPSLTRSRAKELAEQPLTLPELVARYRNFSEDVAAWLRSANGGEGRVVIGIDEVDKILDGDRAESFLNDIKAVFGVPGCLYLVSLSEDAMAIFARRALTIRTAFDSAFDEVVPVGPMSYQQSEQLLFKRVTGVPRPFLALCHILAGGLPRDIVRAVRALVDKAPAASEQTLDALASALVQRDLASLRQASLSQLAERAGTDALLSLLHGSNWPGTTPRHMERAASSLTAAARNGQPEELSQACRELVVSLSFYATVLTVFGRLGGRLVTQLKERRYDLINDLAAARHAMRLNVGLAHSLLEQYRQHNGITS